MQRKQQSPPAIFSVCAPSDIQGLERWEAHLRPLEQAGTVSIWSVRHLQPGTDRLKHLYHHLDQADLVVLLLSADFFTDGECEALMKRALERHQQGTVRVIPLLLRPFAFHETKLATFAPFPSNGRPVVLWENTEAAFDDCVRNLRRILGRPVTKPLHVSIEGQNRVRMLQRLRRIYEELFTQSLAGVTQIELGLADKPGAVQNAVTLLFRTPTRPEQLLPLGTPILRVYDEATQELLILGAPGAGKSTLLVELARQLVVRAEADERHPLPVILPLSSWAVKRSLLHIWLAEQVAQFYDIPKRVAQRWINEDQLLLLLDGLDEMEETARPNCIAAINAYHRDHLRLPLVVCSRQTEYEAAAKTQRLALQNAVVVQPLAHEAVQAYLKQAGEPLSALRRVLSTNSALASIATTPLIVHILILTYQGTSMRRLSTQPEQLQQQIWTDYLKHMVERKGNVIHYPLDQTYSWLGWLAHQMRKRNQTLFYIEQLQPDWVSQRQRWFYQWSIGLLDALLFFGLVSALFAPSVFGTIVGLASGLVSGLVFGLRGKIEPAEVLTWSWRKLRSRLFYGLALWLPIELIMGRGFELLGSFLYGFLLYGLFVGLFIGLFIGFSRKQLTQRFMLSPNEGTRRSVKNGLTFGLPLGLFVWLIIDLHVELIYADLGIPLIGLLLALVSGLLLGLLFALLFGLNSAIQHYTLRFWLWRSHTFPWKAQLFLDDAVTCILLRRVGGGYSFVHRLLLDYLADLPTRPTPTSATHLPTSSNAPPANNPSA